MTPILYPPERIGVSRGLTFGGKAEGLMRLLESGAATPPFAVIPAEVAAVRPWREEAAAGELQEWFARWNIAPFEGIAVRSSADAEDRTGMSGAGVFETVFVREAEALIPAIERVLDSVQGAAAQAHQARTGRAPRMAVLLQAWVRADMAGVLFSAHPARAHPERCYVEAVRGAGKGLVDGTRTPSGFHLALDCGEIVETAAGRDGPDALPSEVVKHLAGVLLSVEQRCKEALDIEWAFAEGQLWFLQARPLTAIQADPSLRPPECATSWFFDQRFTHPISPFTRSTLLPLIVEIGVIDALTMRGRAAQAPVLYFYGGQAYVPHRSYRAMFAGAPRWWLSADLRQLFPKSCGCAAAPRGGVLDYAWCAVRSVWNHRRDVLSNIRAWTQFARELEARIAAIAVSRPTNREEWTARWAQYDALTRRFLAIHRWSILWAGYFFRGFRVLTRLLPAGLGERIEERLWKEARFITAEANAALARVLRNKTPEAWAAFSARYGHRSGSLDYATHTWAELKDVDAVDIVQGCATPERAPHGPGSWWLYPVRRFLELREEQRFAWERILAEQRRMALDAGSQLASRGVVADKEDVWFLSLEEVLRGLFEAAAPLGEWVRLRRHAALLEQAMEKPPFIGPEPLETIPAAAELRGLGASPGVVHGQAWVMGRLDAPPPALAPPVIAVAPTLDPAHTALLARVQGVVLERGGLLSHAAILAREYHVPLVIGVEDALRRIRPGAQITIDGHRGVVRIDDGRGLGAGMKKD